MRHSTAKGRPLFAVLLGLTACSANQIEPRPDEVVARVAELQAEGELLHGVAAVWTPGRDVTFLSNGRLRYPDGAEARSTTRFRIASLTKVVVQLAALRLVDAGELDLDAPIRAYRPGLDASWAAEVTMRHLLTFRAGLPRELPGDPPPGVELDGSGSGLAFLDGLGDHGPDVPVGSQVRYSNLGYWQAGAVLEAIRLQPLEAVLRELVFEPAGMRDSGLLGAEELDGERHALGHELDEEGHASAVAPYGVASRYSSGGLFSSAGDLVRLSAAVLDGDFLSDASRELLFTRLGTSAHAPVQGNGYVPGFANLWLLSNEPAYAIVLLNNRVPESPPRLVALLAELQALMTGAGAPAAKGLDLDREGWQRIAGVADLPEHPLRGPAATWVSSFLTADVDEHFRGTLAAHGLDDDSLDADDREGLRANARYEVGVFETFGPFTVQGWRPGERGSLEVLFAGPDARWVQLRFEPDPTRSTEVSGIAFGTRGFRP